MSVRIACIGLQRRETSIKGQLSLPAVGRQFLTKFHYAYTIFIFVSKRCPIQGHERQIFFFYFGFCIVSLVGMHTQSRSLSKDRNCALEKPGPRGVKIQLARLFTAHFYLRRSRQVIERRELLLLGGTTLRFALLPFSSTLNFLWGGIQWT